MSLKVMVVDDSVLYRKIVSEIVAEFADIEIMSPAASGDIALKKMEQATPDMVLCDVHMPGKDGLKTMLEIRKRFPSVSVVMMSSISDRVSDITVRALELGALDFIAKPEQRESSNNRKKLQEDLERVLRLIRIRKGYISTAIKETIPKKQSIVPKSSVPVIHSIQQGTIPKKFAIVALGVSTGGPEALSKCIPMLPVAMPVPVVLVQHMPPNFTRSLAESLNKKSAITVVEAEAGMQLKPGIVYIAQGGRHMVLRKKGGVVEIALNDSPPENSCRPAVDVLFRSVAECYSDRGILAVILTGMGSDGVLGVRSLKRHGCYCITQAPESCVVYGMPRAVDEAGLSDISLPVEKIAGEIGKRFGM